MKKILLYCLLAFVILINTGCPKPCIEAEYSFAIQSQITPDMDSVSIGDTIYLISSTPTTMKELSTGMEVDYSGATIGSNLSIAEALNGTNVPRDAVFDFDYVSIKGGVYNDRNIPRPDGVQQLKYEEINGRYELKIGIIPKKRGLYAFGVGNGFSTGRNKKNVCEKASFSISLNNTDQHLYLYREIDPSHQFTDFESKRIYYFKVY